MKDDLSYDFKDFEDSTGTQNPVTVIEPPIEDFGNVEEPVSEPDIEDANE